MKTFEIYYTDLNQVAQKRFKKDGFWHENVDLSPIAVIDMEEDEDDNLDDLKYNDNNN